jgi:hypothetical protein
MPNNIIMADQKGGGNELLSDCVKIYKQDITFPENNGIETTKDYNDYLIAHLTIPGEIVAVSLQGKTSGFTALELGLMSMAGSPKGCYRWSGTGWINVTWNSTTFSIKAVPGTTVSVYTQVSSYPND